MVWTGPAATRACVTGHSGTMGWPGPKTGTLRPPCVVVLVSNSDVAQVNRGEVERALPGHRRPCHSGERRGPVASAVRYRSGIRIALKSWTTASLGGSRFTEAGWRVTLPGLETGLRQQSPCREHAEARNNRRGGPEGRGRRRPHPPDGRLALRLSAWTPKSERWPRPVQTAGAPRPDTPGQLGPRPGPLQPPRKRLP